jgi:mRNA-degrading endonuclease RelE of RelBE toxin-antitoxin system
MSAKAPPFNLSFERLFLESYERLGQKERRIIDKAVKLLAQNPRHPSLKVHKAKSVKAKYSSEGDDSVFIAYASKELRLTFEYGPELGMISFRNCGFHDACESKI